MARVVSAGGVEEVVVPSGASLHICTDVGDENSSFPALISKKNGNSWDVVEEFSYGYKTYTNEGANDELYMVEASFAPVWINVGVSPFILKFVSAPEYTTPQKNVVFSSGSGDFGLINYLSGIVEVQINGGTAFVATIPSFSDLESSGVFSCLYASKELVIYNKSASASATLSLDNNTGHILYSPNAAFTIGQNQCAVLRVVKTSNNEYKSYLLSLG